MTHIYIIHENKEWTAPLLKHLDDMQLPYKEWFLNEGTLDLSDIPPEGIFYNRISASSHTRDHRYSAEYTASVLAWLNAHNRIVLNSERALALEISKIAQYSSLQANGIKIPKTIAAIGKTQIIEAAKKMTPPFITKHNRGGKGLGVQLFHSIIALETYINNDQFEKPIDGITLIQEYIQSPEPYITRCEFINGKFLYAVRVDTSEGFELCPADACSIGDNFCPTTTKTKAKFEIIENFNHPILTKYEKFLSENDITFAGIEFIKDKAGNLFTYDVNTNTNYNTDAENNVGIYGMKEIANVLGTKLKELKAIKKI
ncbi:alpha-L-glutamate ligase [Lottiidibacillus patelloidae]|uniref:Alpha-L-glutamate ligase n=1 Tax=Lottiidibacillus patelloidae TaxID=2670334 RepID=A0A263BRF9_9BACI|nr:alpha-L-glutamate ligase [Lottiidibacillus patelloidae]OZM56290.1 alpha-L-glutamate ligase [Lottiidibacillus patelloidae]